MANTSLSIDKVMNKHPFEFQHRPFAATPDVENYVPNESIESAIEAISQCIQRSAGPAMTIGPAGIGKSMLCVELAKRLQPNYEIVLLATSRLCTRRALLQNILFELGLHFRDREEGELRLGILEHLKSPQATSDGMLLIVDEAQTMPLRLLEEIRGLTNIHRQGESRVHLVLAGTQLLDERLNHPKMEAFTQRIATRCYLHPLNGEETQEYILRQWSHAVADLTPVPFTPSAIETIYSATTGIPRLINQLCDHALFLANGLNITSFDEELIAEAWSDLQQLPTPWQVNHHERGGNSATTQTIVEFGTLSDEPITESPFDNDLQLTPLPENTLDHFQELETASRSNPSPENEHFDLTLDASGAADCLSTAPPFAGSMSESEAFEADASTGPASLEASHPLTSEFDTSPTVAETVETPSESELTFFPTDVTNPFECDGFEEEELISEQRNAGLSRDLATTRQVHEPAEEILGFAELDERVESTTPDAGANSQSEDVGITESIDEVPASNFKDSDFSFFLSQSPSVSLEESEDSIEDSLTESIASLTEDLTQGLGPAANEPETSHSKTTLDDTLSQLKMETAKRDAVTEPSLTDDWDIELAKLEEERHADIHEETNQGSQKGLAGEAFESNDLGDPSSSTFNTSEIKEVIEQSERERDEVQTLTTEPTTAPDNQPADVVTESPEASIRSSTSSESESQDDKDMIVVDNPVPANPLRIIGSQDQENLEGHSAPESVAFREDYQKLMQRLRGSVKS